MFRRLFLAAALLACVAAFAAPVRVACIGNSITFGYGLSSPEVDSYPAQLQILLGPDYDVANFGHSGATLLRRGHRPYFSLPEFRDALAFAPDIAVIHLGVNDTDPRDWPEFGDEFAADYLALIDSLRAVNPSVRVIVANLSPLRASHFRFRSGTRLWRLRIRDVIERVASVAGAELIDFDEPLRDRQNLLYDGIHPDARGYRLLAEAVFSAVTGDYGPLRMPEVFQSGMVLQRNTPLRFYGTARSGAPISLSLDGVSYSAVADSRGCWEVVTAPLDTGGPYTLQVSDGNESLSFSDILAGELWIAAGQSNMEFSLGASIGGRDAVRLCADSLLRIFDRRPVAPTNNAAWSSEIVEKVDSLCYYLPASWHPVSPSNASRFSAVAYYFARELRQAMPDVPVGVISMPVGGSTLESWIDVNSLEEAMPEILVNWTSNDYVMKWAQGRALTNSGKGHRHPYEPSYLFSTGVRPLGPLPLAGVIWYQGESNAHNTDIFEQLYPLFVSSWRTHFRNPSLPVYSVQLSSIERPSWPAFRDAQRRLDLAIPFSAMAVSSDHGDPADVHPKDKRPVGHRLACQALHRLYGFDSVTPQGPTPVSVVADGPSIVVELDFADSLATSDGLAPRSFEVAETDGFFFPADAHFSGNKIIISAMSVPNPRYVRYAWQPFTEANVINSDSLPMSTFKARVDNFSDFEIEEGMEYGVSAPFAGRLGGFLVMAGGCNFPVPDPLAPDAPKKFYRGVYACSPSSMQWRRVASLPLPMAYGASVPLDSLSMVLIGGTSPDSSLSCVNLLSLSDDGSFSLSPLPSLPAPVDNMAAAAIGRRIYLAGGNVAGVPSSSLFVLDLDDASPAWKELKKMPGNPRVQPVMTAGVDAEGETCLFLFGGFSPRMGSREPSIAVDGLKFSPSRNRWSTVSGPSDSLGNPVTLSGACAALLPDGSTAFAGGVNKDVFLDAITRPQPDYLSHPISWYRFNPEVFIFSPSASSFTSILSTPDAARAGAVLIPFSSPEAPLSLHLLAGELKPRIRTPHSLLIPLP